jgi:regulator of nucleoside diphosphate kinase
VRTRNILLTEADHEQLNWLIASSRGQCRLDVERLNDLQNELNRAIVVSPSKVPADVVTMNSRVRIRDLISGRELRYQIVLPKDADVAENRISVLAPIGTALLGYRAGSTVEWRVPSGRRHFRILDVEYQPEAARTVA